MPNLLFLYQKLPSFRPPLERNAALLLELAGCYPSRLIYFGHPDDNPKDLAEAQKLCERVLRLEPLNGPGVSGWLRRTNISRRTEQLLQAELAQFQLDFALVEKSLELKLARPGLTIFNLDQAKIEVAGTVISAGPGIDAAYFRRQSPINITSKQVLFAARIETRAEGAACREAIRLMTEEVWPTVRQRHPDATLRIVAGDDCRPFLKAISPGEACTLEYGTISPTEYEAGRLALAPYREVAPNQLEPWLEAWAMQLPLITLPAAATALENLGGRLGSHFLKGEDGPSLAALISRLLEIRGPGLHLAEAGRKLIEAQFSWAAMAHQLEEIIQNERRIK